MTNSQIIGFLFEMFFVNVHYRICYDKLLLGELFLLLLCQWDKITKNKYLLRLAFLMKVIIDWNF